MYQLGPKTDTYWRYRKNENRARAELRSAVIAKLGGVCKRCGFSDRRALQIDHVHGNGATLRKIITVARQPQDILHGSEGYQLLCANCNWIKRAEDKEEGNVTLTGVLQALEDLYARS